MNLLMRIAMSTGIKHFQHVASEVANYDAMCVH